MFLDSTYSLRRVGAACLLGASLLAATPAALADGLTEARTLIDGGQYTQALTRLDDHLRENPQDAEARFTRGLVLVKLARTDDAIQVFADITRDYPQLPEPYNNLAVLYAQTGDYEKARDALEAALATHPSYATAHENLGDVYTALATAAYNRALMLDRANDTVRVKLNLLNQMDASQTTGAGPTTVAAAQNPAPVRPTSPTIADPLIPAAGASTAPSPTINPAPSTQEVARVSESVRAALFAWAQAWSNKDADGYLAAYDTSFRPENGSSRANWARRRRQRVTAPSFINVNIVDPTVEVINQDRARVTFDQIYESPTYSDRVTKLFEMQRRGPGDWRIVRETVLATR